MSQQLPSEPVELRSSRLIVEPDSTDLRYRTGVVLADRPEPVSIVQRNVERPGLLDRLPVRPIAAALVALVCLMAAAVVALSTGDDLSLAPDQQTEELLAGTLDETELPAPSVARIAVPSSVATDPSGPSTSLATAEADQPTADPTTAPDPEPARSIAASGDPTTSAAAGDAAPGGGTTGGGTPGATTEARRASIPRPSASAVTPSRDRSVTTAGSTLAPGSTSTTGPSTTVPSTSVRPSTPSGVATSAPAAAAATTANTTSTTAATTTTTTTGTTTTTTTASAGGAGRVVWQDDFSSLDTSTWRLESSTYGDGNNELQCYRPENVSASGGRLVLRAVTETHTCPNGSTRQVTSGMIRSQGVTFSPGQAIEFRVKLTPADPSDQGGLWPAVWASGWAGGGWPRGGELDWLEVMTAERPGRAVFSMHHAGPDGAHRLQNRSVAVGSGQNFSDSWHTVRFDYGRDGRLTWHLDGRAVFTVDNADTLQGYPAPFDQTIGEIKINLALGGTPGPLAAGAVGSAGATFEVDYIRILDL